MAVRGIEDATGNAELGHHVGACCYAPRYHEGLALRSPLSEADRRRGALPCAEAPARIRTKKACRQAPVRRAFGRMSAAGKEEGGPVMKRRMFLTQAGAGLAAAAIVAPASAQA